jgi:putative hemolysin
MTTILLCLVIGLALSAYFSGSETGFYRVTRVRLVMDAKSGNLISKALLWLTNHPTVVVATVLIGNNIANYLVSFGLVLASEQLLVGWNRQFQALFPMLMTPLLFIYGELLPKFLFFQVPYRLLRAGAPLMLLFTVLFFPVSIFVMGLEAVWNRFVGGTARQLGSSLERKDLQRVMMEGQEAGVLLPIQREIAQNLFTYGLRPVRQFCVPLRAIPRVSRQADREEILRQARRGNRRIVGVIDGNRLVGCYQLSDLLVAEGSMASMLPVVEVRDSDSNIQVLTRLQSTQCPLACVVDAQRRTLGVVERERLSVQLLAEN